MCLYSNLINLIFKWSPDKSILLIGLNSGDIQIFDFNGNYIVSWI